MLLATLRTGGAVALGEEIVAGRHETLPDGIGLLLGHGSDGAPLLLQGCHLVGSSLPVGAVLQGLGLLAEGNLLFQIDREVLLGTLEERRLLGEEHVARCTETVEDLLVLLLGSEAQRLPLGLQRQHLLRFVVPLGVGCQFVEVDCFHDFADGNLLLEVLLLGLLDFLEILLVAAVDNRGSLFEALPYSLAEVLGHGACLAEFLMKFLQLAEGHHHVGLVGQFLGLLAELRLDFEVLLEVVVAEHVVELADVVELLRVALVGFPEFGCLFGRNVLDLAPLLLDGLEIVVRHGHRVGIIYHRLQAFENGLLAQQVLFADAVEFLLCLSTFLANRGHHRLELLFLGHQLGTAVGKDEGIGIVAGSHEGFLHLAHGSVVPAIEHLLEMLEFFAE